MHTIKDLSVLLVDFKLRDIATEAMEYMESIGVDPVITSAHRPGDPGVHGQIPCRGLDLRCFDQGTGEAIAEYVNKRWLYDPSRPEKVCCMFHRVAGNAYHLHLQSHPNTRRVA